MAKEIGIKLNFTSSGEQKVIKNLGDLENELTRLQQEIKTLDFGSAAFNEAAKNIQLLKSRIDEVDKATEGIGAEKRFRALGDAISVLTGSFQVFSGILGLVITQEEDLEKVQRAEAAALQVVNIALGINAINTALVESATLRATIATQGYNAITKTATAIQQAFNAALRANPIGLVVTSVLALSAAVFGLVKAYQALNKPLDEQAELAKRTKALENDLLNTRIKASVQLAGQLKILTDSVETRNLERKTLEDLKKVYPGLNAFIRENNKLTSEGIKFIELNIKARQAEAALTEIRAKQVDEEIRFAQVEQEIRAEYGFTQQAANLLRKEREEGRRTLAALNEVEIKYTKQLDKALGELEPLNKELAKQAKAEAEAAKNVGKNTKALDDYTKSLIARNEALDFYIKKLEELSTAELEYTADVLEQQDKIITNQQNLLEQRTNTLALASTKLQNELGNLLRRVIPDEKELKVVQDRYKLLFDTLGSLYQEGLIDTADPLGFDALVKKASEVKPELEGAFEFLSPDSRKAIVEFFNELRSRIDFIQGEDFTGQRLVDMEDLELLKTISNLEDEIYKIRRDSVETGLTEADVRKTGINLIKQTFGFERELVDLTIQRGLELAKGDKADQNRLKAIDEQIQKYNDFTDAIFDSILRSADFYKGIEEVQKQVDANNIKINEGVDEITRKLTDDEFKGLVNFFKDNIEQFDVLTLDILNNFDDYINKVGQEGVSELLRVLGEGIRNLDGASREQLEAFQQTLEVAIAIGQALGNNTADLEALLEQVNKKLKTIPTEAQESAKKALGNLRDFLQTYLQELNGLATQFQNILQTQSSLLLEQLASDEEAALRAVAGTSKRLLEEQEEIRKEYAKRRFDIEKKARINELRFTLAQTISDVALSVANTLANIPPPFNAILAASTAALGGAQISLVRDQITFAQSQQFVGRRGGLISGESHEGANGGVPAMLEGGEFVVNRAAVAQYGELIGELNSSTGGRRLSIDDSRLVQAIASQNKSTPPLKAFVLYNDIQDTEKLNSKITQLARL
jgi:DNA repair exonuclease SbcCD ATPase subunit